MESLNKYNIKLRLVHVNDAAFIIKLRTDASKSRFISETDSDLEGQELWINQYKKRENNNEEFYFIATDENNVDFATYRIYNIKNNSAEIGSFVSLPGYKLPLNVIKVDIIVKSFVFFELKYDILYFEVRKNNKSVINYHKKFDPLLKDEDEKNYYYVLKKDLFIINKIKFEKLF